MNDLRRHGSLLYITDSGSGGIIIHDLATGQTRRRLSGQAVMKATPGRVPDVLAHVQGNKPFRPPNSDLIEVTADGRWLYWAAPTGPLRRVETRHLLDPRMSDDALVQHVQHVFDNSFSGGCAMDSAGNFYFCETEGGRVTLLAPDGRTATLVSDPALLRPDGGFISADRRLYLPVKRLVQQGDGDKFYAIYAISLPDSFEGLALGGPVTGAWHSQKGDLR
jgi:sugar lactone lactonase YvrE